MELKVLHDADGLSLIRFLSQRLSISNRKAKEIIDQRRVFVNGRRVWMARHILKAGDLITGLLGLEQPATERPLPVIYEDDNYLVINKPAGIASNGPNSAEQLLNLSVGRATASGRAAAGRPCEMLGRDALALPRHLLACHRLDRDTSGCLLFAKNHAAKERIIPLFARDQISKKYEAIVRGRLTARSTTITKPLEGLKAVTHVHLMQASCNASHISVLIETGRTHQIRKHMASLGHPVLGDKQYSGNRAASRAEMNISRQMLHAVEISFVSPMNGKLIQCRAELPVDFKECLKRFNIN